MELIRTYISEPFHSLLPNIQTEISKMKIDQITLLLYSDEDFLFWSNLLFCLHSWVMLSYAICWQKYGRVSHTIQKLGQEIRNTHVKERLMAKEPASVKFWNWYFCKGCRKTVIIYVWCVCKMSVFKIFKMFNTQWWIFLSKFFCKISLYDLAKSGSNLGFSTKCILSYWVPHCNHMCEK